jgi:hypothetical protein
MDLMIKINMSDINFNSCKNYLLVGTEFKNLNSNIGPLNKYCKEINNELFLFSNDLYDIIKNNSNEKDIIKKYITNNFLHFFGKRIIGNEFIAIILNYEFIKSSYNIIISVLKYDLINKKIYYDLFISQFYYSDPKMQKYIQKHKHPLITNQIYEFTYNDLNNVNLLTQKIYFLDDKIDLFKIKIGTNFKDYLCGFVPLDDNYNKNIYKNTLISVYDEQYVLLINKLCELIKNDKIFETKKYIVIATSYELLDKNIYYINQGNNNHAEYQLINNHKLINPIIIRLYYNYKIGCGVPCQNCVKFFLKNGIKQVSYSVSNEKFIKLPITKNTYTYTTTGYKILDYDKYLYEDFIIKKRIKNE